MNTIENKKTHKSFTISVALFRTPTVIILVIILFFSNHFYFFILVIISFLLNFFFSCRILIRL